MVAINYLDVLITIRNDRQSYEVKLVLREADPVPECKLIHRLQHGSHVLPFITVHCRLPTSFSPPLPLPSNLSCSQPHLHCRSVTVSFKIVRCLVAVQFFQPY